MSTRVLSGVSVLINTTTFPSVFQIGSPTYSVVEGSDTATVTVTRTGSTAGGASVTLSTSNGTATAGSDHTATTRPLTFGPGETSKSVTIPILADAAAEPLNETVNLTLSDPKGGKLGTQATAVLTIVDNDPAAGGDGPLADRRPLSKYEQARGQFRRPEGGR